MFRIVFDATRIISRFACCWLLVPIIIACPAVSSRLARLRPAPNVSDFQAFLGLSHVRVRRIDDVVPRRSRSPLPTRTSCRRCRTTRCRRFPISYCALQWRFRVRVWLAAYLASYGNRLREHIYKHMHTRFVQSGLSLPDVASNTRKCTVHHEQDGDDEVDVVMGKVILQKLLILFYTIQIFLVVFRDSEVGCVVPFAS